MSKLKEKQEQGIKPIVFWGIWLLFGLKLLYVLPYLLAPHIYMLVTGGFSWILLGYLGLILLLISIPFLILYFTTKSYLLNADEKRRKRVKIFIIAIISIEMISTLWLSFHMIVEHNLIDAGYN